MVFGSGNLAYCLFCDLLALNGLDSVPRPLAQTYARLKEEIRQEPVAAFWSQPGAPSCRLTLELC
jgi:hypothetical protein